MMEIALVIVLAIVSLYYCKVVHGFLKYINEEIEQKHKENRITDYIFSKCQKLGEQEEMMLGRQGVMNVSEFNKLDAKIDVLLELMAEINKEEA